MSRNGSCLKTGDIIIDGHRTDGGIIIVLAVGPHRISTFFTISNSIRSYDKLSFWIDSKEIIL